jgi:hypothetical protein
MPESDLPAKPVSRNSLRHQRDQRLRRIVRRCRILAPHLDNAAFGPVLQSFGRISLLLADSYEKIRGAELLGEDGELRPSIDTIRKLADTQAKLAEKLGLTPSTLRTLGREKRVDLAGALAENDDGREAE